MNTKIFKSLGAAAIAGCLLLMTSCKPNDAQTTKAATAAVTAIAPNVSVTVQNGVATLSGTVADEATQAAVDSTVKSVKGVTSVTDNITVPLPPAPVTVNPDDVLQHSVDSSLQAKNISGITVSAANGVVTLTGTVTRSNLKTVMQIANESHPQKVVNQLTIK